MSKKLLFKSKNKWLNNNYANITSKFKSLNKKPNNFIYSLNKLTKCNYKENKFKLPYNSKKKSYKIL
jgi:hypothetical protein